MDIELIIITCIICFAAGYLIGIYAVRLALRRAIKNRMTDLLILIEQDDGSIVPLKEVTGIEATNTEYNLKCEVHHGAYYFFEADTDKFICQGNTLEEAHANYLARGIKRDATFTHNDATLHFKFEQ